MLHEQEMDMMTEGRLVFQEIPDQSVTVYSLMPESLHDPWHQAGTNHTDPVRIQSCLPQVK
jgi:hypothetical protein